MKLYTVQFEGNYGNGMVVVAAENIEQAEEVSYDADHWFVGYGEFESASEIGNAVIECDFPHVVDHVFYQE